MTTVEHRMPGWAARPATGALRPPVVIGQGRHRAVGRAALTLRRLFYLARHRRL